MPKSRAEYMRARRAAQREARPELRCPNCSETFIQERGNQRFCSTRCRADTWRDAMHRVALNAPDGATCTHRELEDYRVCGQPATVVTFEARTSTAHLVKVIRLCAEHAPDPTTVVCDEHAACRTKGQQQGGCPVDNPEELFEHAVRQGLLTD